MTETDHLRAALAVERTWYRHKARSERRQRDRAATASRELRDLRGRLGRLFGDLEGTTERLNRRLRTDRITPV